MIDISLSVALVTRNRPQSLERCLRSLRSQTVQPFEVVVSDDSSELENQTATKSLAQRYDCRYLCGPQRGLYANRNYVSTNCTGTHVRTMDDDHEFPDGHWQAVVQAVQEDPLAVWTIGEYYSWAEAKLPGPCCGEVQPRGFSAPPKNLDNSMAISDGATIYPKSVLQQHRMLDYFPFGKSYLEFGARLKANGIRLRHLPTTFIIHHIQEVGRSYQAEVLDSQTGFLAAALTYGIYFPTQIKALECWSYFTMLAVRNSLLRRKNAFGAQEWKQIVKLYFEQRRAFLAQKI